MKLFNRGLHHGTTLAVFDYEVIDNVIVITDLHDDNNCSRTVTNDVESVIELIRFGLKGFKGRRIIYKDTDHVWDEIVIKDDQFFDFKSLNKKTLTETLRDINNGNS